MESSFHFVCSIRGCLYSFKMGSTFSSFKTHASRKHPDWKEYVNTQEEELPPLGPTMDTAQGVSDVEQNDMHMEPVTVTDMTCSELCSMEPLQSPQFSCPPEQRAAALFLLTFQEKYRVSQTGINFAVGSINTIVESVCDCVQRSLEEGLPSAADTIRACFNERENPFVHLQTEYKQSKFYQEHFGLVVSDLYQT